MIKSTLLVALLLLVVPSTPASGQKTDVLDGHFRLYYQDAIFTPVYEFEHPDTKVKVTLACVNHAGLGDYFKEVGDCLADCTTVIYEDNTISTTSVDESSLEELKKSLAVPPQWTRDIWISRTKAAKEQLFNEYVKSMYAAFIIGAIASGCELEADILQEKRDMSNWISGDEYFVELLKKDPVKRKAHELRIEKLFRKTNTLPGEIFAGQVWDIKLRGQNADTARTTGKIEYHPRTFYSVIYNIYSVDKVIALYQEIYVNPADEAMFEGVFDPLVTRSTASADLHVGIKYGVEHATHLTKLLKDRDFELKETTWLVSMPLKYIPDRLR
jgi:hypothetical protein